MLLSQSLTVDTAAVVVVQDGGGIFHARAVVEAGIEETFVFQFAQSP